MHKNVYNKGKFNQTCFIFNLIIQMKGAYTPRNIILLIAFFFLLLLSNTYHIYKTGQKNVAQQGPKNDKMQLFFFFFSFINNYDIEQAIHFI